MRGAIYARYSSDRQRETSIEDQVRNCTRHAEREGITVRQVFQDKAVTGAVTARPGYQRLLESTTAGSFDVVLVDDLSRLSRDDYEMEGFLRRFTFQGIRVIAVSDGYDNNRKGHKIHSGFKGLMNEMFLDDLRERTHRGMTGQAIKGFNCGGRTFGYRNVPIEDSVRKDAYGRPVIIAVKYVIDEAQAATVRQIHEWYAAGYSYRWIARELNHRRLVSSRNASWAMTAIKVILENQMYEGRLTWNRRVWMKHPDTGKRTYKDRPKEEWIVTENPDLRIVPREVIESVRRRQKKNQEAYAAATVAPLSQRYLLSGLMACAECGGNFVIVANHRYGCAARHTKGLEACGNSLTVSRHIIEERILADLKGRLLAPDNFAKFKRTATDLIEQHNASDRVENLGRQLRAHKLTRDNILTAIKQGIITAGMKEALERAEAEVAELKHQMAEAERWNVSAILPRALERYQDAVRQLEDRLSDRIEPAREAIRSLLGENIRIHRKGEHLEAEIPHCVPAILANSVNFQFGSLGCGGPQRNEPNWVSLEPRRLDSMPMKYRQGREPKVHGKSAA